MTHPEVDIPDELLEMLNNAMKQFRGVGKTAKPVCDALIKALNEHSDLLSKKVDVDECVVQIFKQIEETFAMAVSSPTSPPIRIVT